MQTKLVNIKESIMKILDQFNKNVKGKKLNTSGYNDKHHGKEGHELEKLMEIKHNSYNSPDIYNFELKKDAPVITFGDYTPDIDCNGNKITDKWWTDDDKKIEFMKKYGGFNKEKNRWSWTGRCDIKKYNKHGQKLIIDKKGTFVYYKKEYDKIKRDSDNILEGKLFGWSHKLLKEKIEKKFHGNGSVICFKNKNKEFADIKFYEPISYDIFLEGIKNGEIYLDPGPYIGNSRAYMSFRARSKTWWYKIPELKID